MGLDTHALKPRRGDGDLRNGLPSSFSVAPGGAWTYRAYGPMAPAMGYSLPLLRSFAPSITYVLAKLKSRQIAGSASCARQQHRDACADSWVRIVDLATVVCKVPS